jgi:hypothetical protein
VATFFAVSSTRGRIEMMDYRILYLIEGLKLRFGLLCGKIGEWFLWQEWKQCTDREEFNKDIRRLRGIDELEELLAHKE